MIRIEIDKTSNDAFREDARGEAARILRHLADRVESGADPRNIYDLNGNVVGKMSSDFTQEDD
jgi:hypothetical protein